MNVSVKAQPRPMGPVVMYQNWRRLLFLHWSWNAGEVQASLPPGLTVDTWSDRAWIGLVPFRMQGVRPRFLPAVPGLSDFPELNVRTYVRDRKGRAGVWFYSLDCSQPLAVWVARRTFGLPYFHAAMRERVRDRVFYECSRRGADRTAYLEYGGSGPAAPAGAGTIEQFLVERYRLFAVKSGALLTGEVQHEPYPIQHAAVPVWSADPLRLAGFDPGAREPEHVVFSPGVNVRVFAPAKV